MNNNNFYAASEVAKNNKGEQDAIEGYFQLINLAGMPPEFYADIKEIISDEMNHSQILSKWAEKLSGIMPAKN